MIYSINVLFHLFIIDKLQEPTCSVPCLSFVLLQPHFFRESFISFLVQKITPQGGPNRFLAHRPSYLVTALLMFSNSVCRAALLLNQHRLEANKAALLTFL